MAGFDAKVGLGSRMELGLRGAGNFCLGQKYLYCRSW